VVGLLEVTAVPALLLLDPPLAIAAITAMTMMSPMRIARAMRQPLARLFLTGLTSGCGIGRGWRTRYRVR